MTKLISMVAGMVLLGTVGVAQAAEPLTDEEMDDVTAGVITVLNSGGSIWSAATDATTATAFAIPGFTQAVGDNAAAGQAGAGGNVLILF